MPLLFSKTRKFNSLLEQHWEGMYQASYAWCHNPHVAADLVQDTVESALRNYGKFTETEHLRKWLYKVLINKWRDYCRKQNKQVSLEPEKHDSILAAETSPENSQQLNETITHVYQAMSLLSIEHREVLSLVALEGFSYELVANILDTPIGTVMSRLHRGRSLLRKHLDNPALMSTSIQNNNSSHSNVRRIK